MFKYIKVILLGWITIPHILVYLISRNRKTISIDLDRWSCFTPFGRKLYPNELEVYYETDDFVCYKLHQNVECLYNLAIDYGYNNPKE